MRKLLLLASLLTLILFSGGCTASPAPAATPTPIPSPAAKPDKPPLPILTYHCVSDDTSWGVRELFVSPENMEAQLAYLTERGFTTVTFEDFPNLSEIANPVMLTFDDGYRDNYLELFPLLQKYEMKATIFIIPSAVGRDYVLTESQVRELSESGLVSIQSHTLSHCRLGDADRNTVEKELSESAAKILELTGCAPIALSYPFGSYNRTVRKIAASYYRYAVTTRPGVYIQGSMYYEMRRQNISRDTTLSDFINLLN